MFRSVSSGPVAIAVATGPLRAVARSALMARDAKRKHAAEYFERFPKDRYQTEVESWRYLQSQNIELACGHRGADDGPLFELAPMGTSG